MSFTQNFDGVTPPALPSGWNTTGSGWATTTAANGISPTSSPNMCGVPGGASGGPWFLTFGTLDGQGGDVVAQCNLNNYSGGNPGISGLTARGSAATLASSSTYYATYANWNTGEIYLVKVVSGTSTTLASQTPIGGISGWVAFTLTCNGSSLSVALQRASDDNWLNSTGTWQSGQTTALTATDGSITGQGYAGLYAGTAGSSYDAYWDDWSLSGIAGPPDSGLETSTEGADAGALTAAFTSGATLGGLEFPDIQFAYGQLTAGAAAPTESADLGALAGVVTIAGTAAPTEAADAGALAGYFATSPTLFPTESPDAASLAGGTAAPAALAATEASDVAAIAAGTAGAGSSAATEAHDAGALEAVALAVPPGIVIREAPDVAAFVGVGPGLGYNIYSNNGMGGPIDYATPIAVVGTTSYGVGALAPGTWMFAARAFDAFGEEQNLDCSVTIVVSASNTDVTAVPAPPSGLRALPAPGGTLKVEWFYPAVRGVLAPTGFHVYVTAGATISYGSPAATVPIGVRYQGMLQSVISGLASGQLYTVACRAYNAAGEEPNTVTVTATADAAGPPAVAGLAAATGV